MRNKHRATTILALLALVLVLGASAKSALAYFTTYATARGGVLVTLAPSIKPKEEFVDWKKIIAVENTGETDCYVRVKVIAGKQYTITLDTADGSSANWLQGADGYYYTKVVPVAETTPDTIVVAIETPAELKTDFNVVVITECTPVTYDTKGNPVGYENADWTMAAVKEAE